MTAYIKFGGSPVYGDGVVAAIIGPRGRSAAYLLWQAGIIDAPTADALNDYLTSLWIEADERIDVLEAATGVGGLLKNGQVIMSPEDAVSLRDVAPQPAYMRFSNLPQAYAGRNFRTLSERFPDNGGLNLEDYLRDAEPMNMAAAVSDALNESKMLVISTKGFFNNSYITPSRLTDATLTFHGATGPGGAPHAVHNEANHMLFFSGTQRCRFIGPAHFKFRTVPGPGVYGARFANGASQNYIPELILENCNGALYFDNCSDIYIGRIIAPGALSRITATSSAQNIFIGEIIGPSAATDSISASATITVGPSNPLLAALAKLTPTANKMIYFDASGVAQLTDWIIDQSFTPGISCDTPGDLAISGLSTTCTYSKRGRQVTVEMSIAFTPTFSGAASGNLKFTGLPFAAKSSTAESALAFHTIPNFTWPSSATQIAPIVASGQDYINIRAFKSGASTATVAISNLTSGLAVTFRLSGTYRTAS